MTRLPRITLVFVLWLLAPQAQAEEVAPARDRFGDPLPPGALARVGTVRLRHGATISSFALSPDDHTLITASSDHTVRLWDVATGREVRRLPGHEGRGNYGYPLAALSPDGKVVATGFSDYEPIRLWDAATGKRLRHLQNPNLWLSCLAFSADGKTVAAGGEQLIAVWDAASGRLLHLLNRLNRGEENYTLPVPIAFAPEGRLLASGGLREIIRLWDLKTGKEQRRLTVQSPWPKEKSESPNYYGLVVDVAFSPDGRILASAAKHSPVRLWDVTAGKEVRSLKGDRFWAVALAFSPDGKMLATGEVQGAVRVWATASGKEVCRIQAHKNYVSGMAFLHDGKTLATSGDSTIRLWDIRSGAEITPDRGHSTRIDSCILSADGRTLITGGADGGIRWWDVATGKELRRSACLTGSPSGVGGLDLSPDGAMAAYRTEKPVSEEREVQVGIELWDLTARKKRAQLERPNINGAYFSPDGKTLFAPVWDVKHSAGFILSWDTATGKELRTLAKTPKGFDHISLLSADGKLLAGVVRGQEKTIYAWDTATGKELCRVPASPDFDPFLAISSDNKLLAAADGPRWMFDGRTLHQHIHLWDIAAGKEISRFGQASCGYWTAAFSGDGKTLATAGEDNLIRLWEMATGGERLHLMGHAGQINKLMFADMDRTLISTSFDTTALVWDVTGLRRPTQAADQVRSSPPLPELWSALADPDATASYRAMCSLLAAPVKALALLHQHLKSIEDVSEKRMAQLIADLDADAFAVREKAAQELRKAGELAEPALRKALAARPALEMRRRLQELLVEVIQHQGRPAAKVLRQLRAIEVLERIGTPEAQRLLETLADGAAGARQTREACMAMQRLRSARSAKSQDKRP